MKFRTDLSLQRATVTGALLILAATGMADSSGSSEPVVRENRTTMGLKVDRDRGLPMTTIENAFNEAAASGRRSLQKLAADPQKAGSGKAIPAPNTEFWFYAADVVLFNDRDGDGFFHGIDLLFDADTIYTAADVYAVAYLSLDGGDWVEYAATEDFTINGAVSDDEFVVVTELVSGYPSGSYDILIELFDAFDNTFLAAYGPEDTSALAFLSLEDSGRDTPFDGPEVVVVENRGGGATGLWTLLVLAGAALGLRRRQKI